MPLNVEGQSRADVAGYESDKRKKKQLQDPGTAVQTVEQTAGGLIPSDVHISLANLGLEDADLRRASRLAARAYDISPQLVFGRKLDKLKDPITGEAMRMQQIRRLASMWGPAAVYSMMDDAIGAYSRTQAVAAHRTPGQRAAKQVTPNEVSSMIEVLGKRFKDEDIAADEGISVALFLAEHGTDAKRFAANLEGVKRWVATGADRSWSDQVTIARSAADKGITLRGPGDVVQFLFPDLAAGRTTEQAQRTSAAGQRLEEAAGTVTDAQYREATGQAPGEDPFAQYTHAIEYLTKQPGGIEDVLTHAKKLKAEIALSEHAFENSWLNRYVATPVLKGFDLANRGFEIIGLTALAAIQQDLGQVGSLLNVARTVKTGEGVPGAQEAWDQYRSDVGAAVQGKLRIADILVRDWDMPRWQAEASEFVLGWFLDPTILGGKALKAASLRKVFPQLLVRSEVSGEKVLRYSRMVDEFADRYVDDLSRAFVDSDAAVTRFTHDFKPGVMGQTPFDLPMLLAARKEAVARGLSGAELRDAVKDVIRTHFAGGKAPVGSLADVAYTAREADAARAKQAFLDNPTNERILQDAAVRHAAQWEEDALDTRTLLPARFEIPGRVRPVPGFGFNRAIGNTLGDVAGDSWFVRNAKKLPNINPGGALRIHEDPARYFRLAATRAGWGNSAVLNWETRAAQAAGSVNVEGQLKDLLNEFEAQTMYRFTRPVGMSDTTADELLKELSGQAGSSTRIFGVQNEVGYTEDGVPFVRTDRTGDPALEAVAQSQLVNELPAIDPIVMKDAVERYVGSMRLLRQHFIRAVAGIEDVPAITRAAKLPLAWYTEHGFQTFGRAIMKAFKFSAVARPAYIFRVVLGDELLRSLATTSGAWEHVSAYGFGRRALEDTPVPEALQFGDRRIGGMVIERPGRLPYEPLANTYLDANDLAADMMRVTRRREAALSATGDWEVIAPDAKHHLDRWARVLNTQLPNSPVFAEALQGMFEKKLSREGLARHMREWSHSEAGVAEMRRLGKPLATAEDWAERNGDLVWGYTMGDRSLAEHAFYKNVTPESLAKFPQDMVIDGKKVWGRPVIHGPRLADAKEGQWFGKKWAETWYGAMVRNPENVLNRQPYYDIWHQRAKASFAVITKDAEKTPELRAAIDEASRSFAIAHNKRIMFDFTENTRLGEMVGMIFPFMQPFTENIAVWGHILTRRNPALVGYVNRLSQLGIQSGFIKRDPETGEYVIPETWWGFTLPLLWAIGGRGAGGQFSLSAPLTNLNMFVNTTFPVGGVPVPAPGMSPWVQYAMAHALANKDADSSLAHYVFQFGPGAQGPEDFAFDTFIPRWLRMPLQGAFPQLFAEDAINNIAFDVMRMQQKLGQEVNPERARGQARWILAYRGLIAALFPGAAQIKFPQSDLEDLLHTKQNEMGMDKGTDWFLENYPDYDLLTIPKTISTKITNLVTPQGGVFLDPTTGEVSPAPPGLRPESSAYYDKVINDPRFKEFASDPNTAMWAMVLLINAGNPEADKFDPTIYAQQINSEQIRQRTALEGYQSWQEKRFFDVWNPINNEYDTVFEGLTARGLDDQDLQWKAVVDAKAVELERVARGYKLIDAKYLQRRANGPGYEFNYNNETNFPDGVHPSILNSVSKVLAAKSVEGLPAVEGLRMYWDLRNEIKDKLESASLDGLETDGAGKIKSDYKNRLDLILIQYPEFEKFYDTWFSHDLSFNLPTKGQQQISDWRGRADPRADMVTEFDNKIEDFGTTVTKTSADGSQADVSKVYQGRTNYMNRLWRTQPEVVQAWFDEQTAASRRDYVDGLYSTPQDFYSAWDWHLVGVKLTPKAEDWLAHVQQENTRISQWLERTDQSTSSADLHKDLDKWVHARIGKDKSFGAAIEAINTWGWGAVAKGYTTEGGRAGQAWHALVSYANDIRASADAKDLHGDDGSVVFDRKDRALWNNARDTVRNYVAILKQWDTTGTFAQQWDGMASHYRGPFAEWLVPTIWFPLGKAG